MDRSSMQSNLVRFLDCTTPLVPSQFLAKNEIGSLNRLWHPLEREGLEYFTLGDLWSCYDEWSVYGAGVPVRLDTGETIVQYFVPYLSALQIFTSSASANSLRDESDSSCETRDSFSDSFSDESESEKLSRWDGCSSEEGMPEHDSLLQLNYRLGYQYFQYFERSTPYGRVPLMDKVPDISHSHGKNQQGLVYLLSNIPHPLVVFSSNHCGVGNICNALAALCDADMDLDDDLSGRIRKQKAGESVPLPPFGLASYKLQGDVWISDKSGKDQERLVSLLSVADSWLKQLGVQHHDFNHFMGIRS
nr:uncharacterized protein LOC109155867 [Ipomoea batatas]